MTKEIQKKLVLAAGSSLGFVAALALILWFLSAGLKTLSGEIASRRQDYFSRVNQIELLSQLKQDLPKANYYYSVIDNILPTREELYLFTNEINLLAQTRGISRPVFSFTGEILPTETTVGQASFNLSLEGRYASILGFIQAVENSRFLVKISGLDLLRVGSPADNNFRGTLSGKAFFQ
jgi:Tfp pilus assembly protein PilO